MGIDAQVLLEEKELAQLLDQFVCVRLINANALDLAIFQFDYDLSFTTMFFNGDGTIYGRYGSWKHQKNSQENATAGYHKALECRARDSRGYPGKQGVAGREAGRADAVQGPDGDSGAGGEVQAAARLGRARWSEAAFTAT